MSDGTTLTKFECTGNGSLETKVEMTTTDSCDTIPAPQCAGNCETTTYDYDSMGNLLGVVLPNGTTVTYEVDAAGRRIAKSVNDVLVKRWLWDGQLRPIAELEPNGSISSLFVYGDGVNSPDYMVRRDGPDLVEYTFLKDHLGSVRMVFDARNGEAVQQVSYDAWGVPAEGDPGYQPFGFAGGLYDADTGLVRFGARDYSPVDGIWLSKDPIRFAGGSVSLYSYAAANPVNNFDPTGHVIITNNTGAPVVVSGNVGAGRGDGSQSWGVIPPGATGGGAANPIVAYRTREDAILGRNPTGGLITDVDFFDNPCGPHRSNTEADNKKPGDSLGPTYELTPDGAGGIDVSIEIIGFTRAFWRYLFH